MDKPEEGKGCLITVLVLFGLGLIVRFWAVFIVVGLIALAFWCLRAYGEQASLLQAEIWAIRQRRAICRYGERHGRISDFSFNTARGQRELVLSLKLFEDDELEARIVNESLALQIQTSLTQSEAQIGAAFRRLLKENNLELVNDVSVEAQAVRAAEEWFAELQWSREALERLRQMAADVESTLELAPGNALLEPAIPQLEDNQQRISKEWTQIREAMQESRYYSKQLVEFLSVPESVRRMLNFDPQSFRSTHRLQELRQGFEDLVLLNDTFRELSKKRLA